jgi:hypothetical protein
MKRRRKMQRENWTAAELRRLPARKRDAILRAAAKRAEPLYRNDPELTAFDAFGEDDLIGVPSQVPPRE